jgi:hypothetical protein
VKEKCNKIIDDAIQKRVDAMPITAKDFLDSKLNEC